MQRVADHRGFTIVEVLVVTIIFLVIIAVTAAIFEAMIRRVSQQSSSAETLVEGLVGLEVLRSDLKQAGFGLPWSFQSPPAASSYREASVSSDSVPAPGFWPGSAPAPAASWVNSFNDAPASIPRAIQSADTLFNRDLAADPATGRQQGAKYLVIKSLLVGESPVARKWTSVGFVNGDKSLKSWGDPDRELSADDWVIAVKSAPTDTPPSRQLMVDGSGGYSTTFANYSTLTQPHQDGDLFVLYGVDRNAPSMPFNRADYYLMAPAAGMPGGCAPHTGQLFRSILRHDGSFVPSAMLDCVADLQVVYGLDTSGQGFVNSHSTVLPATAREIRAQLREIRVYLLVHEGTKDAGFSYPSRYIAVGESFGGTLQGRNFDLQGLIGTGWQHYRWKVLSLVVRPQNLL